MGEQGNEPMNPILKPVPLMWALIFVISSHVTVLPSMAPRVSWMEVASPSVPCRPTERCIGAASLRTICVMKSLDGSSWWFRQAMAQ